MVSNVGVYMLSDRVLLVGKDHITTQLNWGIYYLHIDLQQNSGSIGRDRLSYGWLVVEKLRRVHSSGMPGIVSM